MSARSREIDYTAIAQRLMDDHEARRPFAPFAAEYGIADIADAYRVQAQFVELKKAKSGGRIAGYKVGLTSKAVQDMCGLAHPVAGAMLSGDIHKSPTAVDGRGFGRFGLEFEIAVLIAQDVPAVPAGIGAVEIEKYVSGVAPAIELVDDRNCEYKTLDAMSLVADNAWNAGIVHGSFTGDWPDLTEVEGLATADGVEIGRGFGRDVLGHPFLALAWLANHLMEYGGGLRSGDIVMTGSLIPTQFPSCDMDYHYRVTRLGEISCRVSL